MVRPRLPSGCMTTVEEEVSRKLLVPSRLSCSRRLGLAEVGMPAGLLVQMRTRHRWPLSVLFFVQMAMPPAAQSSTARLALAAGPLAFCIQMHRRAQDVREVLLVPHIVEPRFCTFHCAENGYSM